MGMSRTLFYRLRGRLERYGPDGVHPKRRAVTAIMRQQKGATTLAVGVPLLIFALPIVNTSLAVARRLAAGQRNGGTGLVAHARGVSQVFKGDRSHIHHRLLDLGLTGAPCSFCTPWPVSSRPWRS
jgi:UDP-N-acetylmuramyl pentapeptide phosphotransferase/UDP-N-acetylglucosamine-1-phosphate transferase